MTTLDSSLGEEPMCLPFGKFLSSLLSSVFISEEFREMLSFCSMISSGIELSDLELAQ